MTFGRRILILITFSATLYGIATAIYVTPDREVEWTEEGLASGTITAEHNPDGSLTYTVEGDKIPNGIHKGLALIILGFGFILFSPKSATPPE